MEELQPVEADKAFKIEWMVNFGGVHSASLIEGPLEVLGVYQISKYPLNRHGGLSGIASISKDKSVRGKD